jgi:prepilin-type N-terminal cleavage/methylation domain-containing protein
MKRSLLQQYARDERAFTLLEVIITIVVVAILAAMMLPYFGTSLTHSGTPISRLKTAMKLNRIMEDITAEYNDRFRHWRPDYTYDADSTILPSTVALNGYTYRTSGGGTSGASEPAWRFKRTTGTECINLPDTACTMTDGSITWYLYDNAPVLADFQSYIGSPGDHTQTFNNVSHTYSVVNNKFIKFDPDNNNQEVDLTGNTADDEYGRYLKVTIGFASTEPNRTEETISTLFRFGNY